MAMSKTVKIAIENLEGFDGTSDFEDWYREFNACVDAWGIEKQDRYQALMLSLDQKVTLRIMTENREADTLPTIEARTTEWLAKELRKRYGYEKTTLKRLEELTDNIVIPEKHP